MLNYPYTETGMNLVLIVAPIVFALAWLFNAYKMGKINMECYEKMTERQRKGFKTIIAIIIAGILLILSVPLIFGSK